MPLPLAAAALSRAVSAELVTRPGDHSDRIRNMSSRLWAGVFLLAIPAACLGQAVADFVGMWRVSENHNFSPNAPASPPSRIGYTLSVTQTPTDLHLSLPRLPAMVFHLDGSENEYVHDNGAWWTKFRTSLRCDHGTLLLKVTSLNGWWKDSRPIDVTAQPTQLEETIVFGFTAGDLRMETTTRDEKPFVGRSVDVLVRVR